MSCHDDRFYIQCSYAKSTELIRSWKAILMSRIVVVRNGHAAAINRVGGVRSEQTPIIGPQKICHCLAEYLVEVMKAPH
jgi:hypothetical protein